ncbi:MAG: hypothetical protein H6656_04190 [Ardenticatenaceae bacterium]|nr:hypothetical protein [Anaerolineales bacterium]MCB9006564.1 hypothetical protein [Ardenticatenaceae bacterium]
MNRILLGVLVGILFGFIDVLLMIPLKFPTQADKRVAMTGAFFDRFAIGVLIGITSLPVTPWLQGIIISILVSLPSAIITRSYVPILAVGVIGGALAGFLIGLWGI